MSDEFVENLKQPSAWLRVLFMAAFVLALYVAGVILLVLMLAQILFSLITGTDNTNLRRLGSSLTRYVSQILEFLTYNREDKPFPFAPFPLAAEANIDDVAAVDTSVAAAGTAESGPATETSMDTAAESAAQVMAESAARRATKATSKTPKAGENSIVATKTPATQNAAARMAATAGTEPDIAVTTVTSPNPGETDVVDRQAKDV